VTQVFVAVHPEAARDVDLVLQYGLQAWVLRSQKTRQNGQALAAQAGVILGQDAGAAEGHPRGLHEIVEIAQAVAEQQFVDIANEGMAAQVAMLPDGGMAGQVVPAGIQLQGIVGQLGAQIGAALGAFQGDGDVGLAFRQADETGYRQDVQRHVRVPALEIYQQRCQNDTAEAFGRADAYVARQALRGAAQGLLCGQQGAFHRFGIGQQALAVFGQGKAAGAGFFKQGHAQRLLQEANTAGHRAVLYAQPLGGRAGPLGAGHLDEVPYGIPVVDHRWTFVH